MTSADIYTSEKVFPYVYRVVNPSTGEFYIGYRSANKQSSDKDLPKYKTSSKQVKFRFDEFNWIIVAEFFTANDAYNFEQLSIFLEWYNPLLLNKNCYHNKKQFRADNNGLKRTPEMKAKLSIRLKGITRSDEFKVKCSERMKKQVVTEETREKLRISQTGRKASEEAKSKMSAAAKARTPQSAETIAKISAAMKGRTQPEKQCPHCMKVGGCSSMTRWHFENCKLKRK